MVWTASVDKEPIKDSDAWVIVVTFSNGSKKILRDYRMLDLNLDALKQSVRNQIDQYNNLDADPQTIPLGELDTTIEPPHGPPDPTPEELARAKYQKDVTKYKQMQRAVILGIKEANDPAITQQQDLIKSAFLDTYFDLI